MKNVMLHLEEGYTFPFTPANQQTLLKLLTTTHALSDSNAREAIAFLNRTLPIHKEVNPESGYTELRSDKIDVYFMVFM